jgi:hypothetical protein
VRNVVDMDGMFAGSGVFNQPLGAYDVDGVLTPNGGWNVSNVETMADMFASTKAFNQPIGDWDVSNVKDMYHMFHQAKAFKQPLDEWDVSQVRDLSNMFRGSGLWRRPQWYRQRCKDQAPDEGMCVISSAVGKGELGEMSGVDDAAVTTAALGTGS